MTNLINKKNNIAMKKEYIKPSILVTEIEPLRMLAASTDRIPVGGSEIKPSAAPEQRGEWGNLWN